VKLSLRFPNDSMIEKLMTYVLEMSRYDTDVDFRDRSRLVTAFLGLSPSTSTDGEGSSSGSGRKEIERYLEELAGKARGIFLAKKMPPTTLLGAVDADGMLHFNIGSLSSLVGHTVSGYEPIPDWQVDQPDLTVRDIKAPSSLAADANKSYDIKGKDSSRSNCENLYSSSSDEDVMSNKGHGGSGSKGNRRLSRSSSDESSDDDSSDSSGSGSSSNSSSSSSDRDGNNRRARSKQQKPISSSANRNDSSSDSGSDDSDEEEFVSRPQAAISNGSRRPANAASANNSSSSGGNSNSSVTKSTVRPSGGGGGANNSNKSKSLDLFDEGLGGSNSASTVSSSAAATANVNNILDTSGTRPSLNGSNSNNKKSGGAASSNFDVFDDILVFPNSSANNNTSSSNSNNSNTAHDNIININNNVFMGLSSSSSPSFATTTSGVGGSGGPLNTAVAPPQHRSESEVLAPQKIIIRPELSRGISLGLAIRLGSSPRPSLAVDAISAMLVFKNCRDTPIRKIRVVFPSDLKRTSIEDIAVLNPNEERQVPIEMVVSADKSKSYRIDLSSDTGSFSGSLSFYSFDLFYPSAATLIEFNSLRQSLTRNSAMGECVKTIPMSVIGGSNIPMEQLEAEIFRRLQRLLNAYLVQGPAGDGSRDILLSAASRRKGLAMEERLAVTIRVSTSNVVLRAISEDSVLDATILDVLKTQLCNESLFTK
jgi:hypothetical protein